MRRNSVEFSNQEIIGLYTEKVNFGVFHRVLFFLLSLITPILLILGYYYATFTTAKPGLFFYLILGLVLLVSPIWIIVVFPKHFKAVWQIGVRNLSRSPIIMLMALFSAFKPKANENKYSQWMMLYYLCLVGWGIFLVVFVVGPILFFNSR